MRGDGKAALSMSVMRDAEEYYIRAWLRALAIAETGGGGWKYSRTGSEGA